MITVQNVNKDFKVPIKGQKGWRTLFFRKNEVVRVLHDLNFTIKKGEFVGYIGPNGAGKSTTIKLLTGILHPTTGTVKVGEFDPYKQRYAYTYNIGVVFGQRSLLEYDIPVIDSFLLYKAIYEVDGPSFEKRLKEFSKILKLDELLHIPVRKLSLGQRMRCEIAASLLHNPQVVFLDEPTIGLDAVAKQEIRDFLKAINKKGVTIILTTHDMDDIEELCKRIIFINEGRILFDGELSTFKQDYITQQRVEVEFADPVIIPTSLKKYVKEESPLVFSIPRKQAPALIPQILSLGKATQFSLHEPRLEDVVRKIYQESGS